MKKFLYPSIALFTLIATTAFVVNMPTTLTTSQEKNISKAKISNEITTEISNEISNEIVDEVNWITWAEMLKAQETEKRKVIIDVYTDWCGWCKHMDKTTFKNSGVATYINKNMYAVKLDAESKEEFKFKGHTFRYIKNGRSGINELAYSLLNGKLSYPSIVYMNGEVERILISPGYKDNKKMLKEIVYIADEIYNEKTWEEYNKE
ncbi:MAG: thioredoxin family protein [Saprospiraceae bacterium]